ncbi:MULTISPECIES: amino acid ABC transporter permease [unclassified Bartonella]|uniref:amino acid ABC transporter permease n=1 Tax=unclassified Bartonella TaxID=2645622 RepID=UPI0015FC55B2|nr:MULTISPECIES: amino acid ABC transporter permease [unclassified Bartonella]UXN05145.1 amino acid ABC transporter permease [Bartonella sp. HY761]
MALDFSFLCKDTADPISSASTIPGCFGNPNDFTQTYMDLLVTGFINTAILSVSALLVAIALGFVIGTMRTLPNNPVLKFLATCWVEIFRNIPILVMVFLCYFVLPDIILPLKDFAKSHDNFGLFLVVIALGLFTSARIAEQVRAGIMSISTGQRYAAQALGFTTFQTYRYILLPRTLRTIMPPLTSESMGIVKNSAAAIGVSIAELMAFLNNTVEQTNRSYEVFIIVTILYVLLALIIFFVMTLIQRSLRIPDNNSSAKAEEA